VVEGQTERAVAKDVLAPCLVLEPAMAPDHHDPRLIASHDELVHGVLVTTAVGLPGLRARCPRFDRWVTGLEALAPVAR
jgi:hypothetical protein